MSAEFIVSARKYRPSTFDSVVGQKSITTTLKNAVKTGKLAHAYLFSGPRGVGKTTCARIFAKTINCENPTPEGEACNQCESCRAFNEGRSFNIHELDAASNNSVDDIRKLIEQVRIPPQIGQYSVYIIDEVHMLSQAAFNAFLKTLEEPPKHAIFIMATTEKHKILPTILSRCQVFDFHRIRITDIVDHLQNIAQKEGINADNDALTVIAQKADGAMRDALSFFDQLVSFTGGDLTYKKVIEHLNVLDYEYYFKLTDLFLEGNYADTLLIFDEILEKGFDAHNFLNGLSEHFRNLLVVKNKATLKLLEVGENTKAKYAEQTAKASAGFLFRALAITNAFDVNYKNAKNKRLHIELALLQLSEITQKAYQPVAGVQQAQTAKPQQQAKQQEQTVKPKSEEHPKTEVKQETPKPNKPAAQEQTTNKTSIGNLLKQTETATAKPAAAETEIKEKKVSPEEIRKSLLIFAEKNFADKATLMALFKKVAPKIEGNTVIMPVPNKLLINQIESYKNAIKEYLTKDFSKELDFKCQLVQTQTQEKPKTNKDKYLFLRQKNPKIDLLQQKFNLDFKN